MSLLRVKLIARTLSIESLGDRNKDVINSEENSQLGVADLEKKLQYNSVVAISECGVPFSNSTKGSAVNLDSFLKSLKDDNRKECIPVTTHVHYLFLVTAVTWRQNILRHIQNKQIRPCCRRMTEKCVRMCQVWPVVAERALRSPWSIPSATT